jgi:hypothetical protein
VYEIQVLRSYIGSDLVGFDLSKAAIDHPKLDRASCQMNAGVVTAGDLSVLTNSLRDEHKHTRDKGTHTGFWCC